MEIRLEINNLAKADVEESFFSEVAKANFERMETSLGEKIFSISLAIVSEEEIRNLNKEYRKKDNATDVLSFSEYENWEDIEKEKENELFLGEIILCYDDIEKYAHREGLKMKNELAKVFSHGILHLLGFSHGEKMFSLQEEVAKNFS